MYIYIFIYIKICKKHQVRHNYISHVLDMHDELLWTYAFYEYSEILAKFGSVKVRAISIAIWVNFHSFLL